MIIVEGFDNAGKTTLAKRIAGKFGWGTYHPGTPPKDELNFMDKCMTSLDMCRHKVVQDRSCIISDLCYGKVLGTEYHVDFDPWFALLQAQRPILIYCRPRTELLLDFSEHELEPHDDEKYVEKIIENSREIIEQYDQLMQETSLKGFMYNY